MAIDPEYDTTSSNSPYNIQSTSFEADGSNVFTISDAVGGTITLHSPAGVLSIGANIYQTALDALNGTILIPLTVGAISGGISTATVSPTLTQGTSYYLKATGYSQINKGGLASQGLLFSFTVPSIKDGLGNRTDTTEDEFDGEEVPAAVMLTKDKGYIKISRSLFTIHAENQNPDEYVAATKDSGILTSETCYSFGTTLYFSESDKTSSQSAGFGFFVSGDLGPQNGYIVKIKTTANAKSNGDEFSILKIVKNNVKQMIDSQSVTNAKSTVGHAVYATVPYKIDVRVKTEATKVFITVYINGFKITATDQHVSTKDTILPKTSKIALLCNMGSVNFDYVYAIPLSQTQYNNSEIENIYASQFAASTFSLAYGDMLASGLPTVDSSTKIRYVEEFGSVAREIRFFSSRYSESEPKFPKYMYKNLNQSIYILGEDMDSFKASSYLLNSLGVTSNIDSSDGSKISVIGNSLMKSEDLIYFDESLAKNDVREELSMESNWIQNVWDAKKLSDWIKTQWSKRQRVITMNVLANPTISIGDTITVEYPYHDLTTTDKFVITNIKQSWSDGLETTVSARSIYS